MRKLTTSVTILLLGVIVILLQTSFSPWGFFGHKKINRLAVFTLPPEMIGFYKANIDYLTEAAVNPDRRRYAVVDEAARHYIDLDHYGDSAITSMPRYWKQAVQQYSEDTLKKHGIVPWHVYTMYRRLREAFLIGDPERILRLSAELGHYISDAHVPLHTTKNYNGQLTGQHGIHGFWESRLPELFHEQYDFFVGRAEYIASPQETIWNQIIQAHIAVDSVLSIEKQLAAQAGEKKYVYETKGNATVKEYSRGYSNTYHKMLNGMVERQMTQSIKMVGSFWYTAWVDAGQPDLTKFIYYQPTEEELANRREEVKRWKENQIKTRDHEVEQ